MNTVSTMATLPNGITLPYLEQGELRGAPVVMLHGFTDSQLSFEPLLSYLPPSWRTIAVTLRGHGDSAYPADAGFRLDDFIDDLALFLDELGINRAILVGHSMGSVIAEGFALSHPDRVQGLVLLGAFASLLTNEVVRGFLEEEVFTITDPVTHDFALAFQESTIGQPVDPTFIARIVTDNLKLPARVWRDTGRALLEKDYLNELRLIDVPTLLLWGEQDQMIDRSEQEMLASAIPGADLVAYADNGHAIHWEAPERVASDLIAFVNRIAA